MPCVDCRPDALMALLQRIHLKGTCASIDAGHFGAQIAAGAGAVAASVAAGHQGFRRAADAADGAPHQQPRRGEGPPEQSFSCVPMT